MACFLTQHKPTKQSIHGKIVKTAGCQCIALEWWIVDSADAYRFSEHGKTADGLKPATICYTRVSKTIPQYKR